MVTLEVRFNSKSSGQSVGAALVLAESHEHIFKGKTCIVYFSNLEDPDIKKLLDYIGRLRQTEIYIDGQQYNPKEVLRTIACDKKILCKGICLHIMLGWNSLNLFLIRHKHEIQGEELVTINSSTITALFQFLEEVGENTYILKKENLSQYIQETYALEAKYCPKYNAEKIAELIKQLPTKLLYKPQEEFIRIPIEPPRQPSSPRTPEYITPPSTHIQRCIDSYYQALLFGTVFERILRKVLHELFPDKLAPPPPPPAPEQLLQTLLHPTPQEIGAFYHALANYASPERKVELLRRALKYEKQTIKDPNTLMEYYYEISEDLANTGELNAAIQILEECHQQFPDDPITLSFLIQRYTERKKFNKAIVTLKKMLELDLGFIKEIETDPTFKALREHPTYRTLVHHYQTEINQSEENG
ncbi:MAG: tetratricopeptide repeat protein [Candidatus Helarchaeota archaeon]